MNLKRTGLPVIVLVVLAVGTTASGLATPSSDLLTIATAASLCGTPPADCHTYSCNTTTLDWKMTGNKAAGTACTDSSACTTNDKCNTSGSCVGTPLAGINDNNACTKDSCNPTTGAIAHSAVVCPPPDACHQPGSCQLPSGACVYGMKPAGTPCNAGGGCACNASGTCSSFPSVTFAYRDDGLLRDTTSLELIPFCGVLPAVGGGFQDATLPPAVPI